MRIKDTKSFIYEKPDPLTIDEHGVWVSGCMAGNKRGEYIGTAPEANYWLLQTEDETSEYPVEEDYWVAALEFADSVGVDIVNSSLYYIEYGYPPYDYQWDALDGKTALASRATNIAAEKGIFISTCAGNGGSWVGTPADSPSVLTVGSVTRFRTPDSFNSSGMTVDGRLKPDVVSLGGGASVVTVGGSTEFRSGTSYATPIISGLAACLWQAYPNLTNKELIEIIKKSGNKSDRPVIPVGHGISDFKKAMILAEEIAKAK